MLGSLINTQDIEGNNTDWVPAFIEITAQNMDKKKTHTQDIEWDFVYWLGILAEAWEKYQIIIMIF